MAYTITRTVAFGSSKASLLTVGYQLVNSNGTNNGSRVTSGVIDLAGGAYGATVTVPDNFAGFIKWDTGEGVPVYASEAINPQEQENADVKTSSLAVGIAAVSLPATLSGATLTIVQGDTLTLPFTGLGNITGRSKLWFSIKDDPDDADTAAVVFIEETAGLVTLNGAAGAALQGSIVITNAVAGDGTVTLDEAATALLSRRRGRFYSIKDLTAGVTTTRTRGSVEVTWSTVEAVA